MAIGSMVAPTMMQPASASDNWRRTGSSSSSGSSPFPLVGNPMMIKCPFLRALCMDLPAATRPVGKCPFLARAFADTPDARGDNVNVDHGRSSPGPQQLQPVLPEHGPESQLLTIHALGGRSDSTPHLDRPYLPGCTVEDADTAAPTGRRADANHPSTMSFDPMHINSSSSSTLLVVGLSVHTASIDMRERLSIPQADWASSIDQLCKLPHIAEAGILSTCNRVEVYVLALSRQRGIDEVLQWMCQLSGGIIPQRDLREHLFVLQDADAAQHLFRVASGLDSLVLGEGQILAQVKQGLKVGQSSEGFGRIMTGLFQRAITAGKRVRSQTSISTGPASVSSAAVELAASELDGSASLSTANILIVGAGKMAQLLVKHLISKGCTTIAVVNRTEKTVQELQVLFPQVTLSYKPLCELVACVGQADVIFTCTASKDPLLCKSAVEALPPAASHVAGVRHFIDISVPRNVSNCVAELATSVVHNVDDLEEVVAANKEERSRKALEAQAVIDEEIKSFIAWRSSLKTLPTIKKLRAYAEKVRADEMQKCLGKMVKQGSSLTPKEKQMIEEMSKAIVNKLLHGPMASLRYDGRDSKTLAGTLQNMHALERIFELHSDHPAMIMQEQSKD